MEQYVRYGLRKKQDNLSPERGNNYNSENRNTVQSNPSENPSTSGNTPNCGSENFVFDAATVSHF